MSHYNESYDLAEIASKVMLERNFQIHLPTEAKNELQNMTSPAPCIPTQTIKDMRNKQWFSIDNEDTFDLDQLTYAEQLSDERTKIYVAIADVDALVHTNSPLDTHAQWNTTSVYTPMTTFPMLPEKLSTNLTSLNPHVDRRAIVVEMIVEKDGSINEFDITQAIVHNYAKLDYDTLDAWLDHRTPPPEIVTKTAGLELLVKLHERIARKIRDYRLLQGALSFKTIEVYPVISNGQVVDLKEFAYNRAREIIEYFMISANNAVTRFLSSKNLPVLRRIVRTPKRWDRIVALAATYHETLPSTPDVKALSAFLRKRKQADSNAFPDLSLAIIKLIGRGEYVVGMPGKESEGHFDLALKDYAHSTAPNRRYPDLILQRLLKSVFEGTQSPYSIEQLATLAAHCTTKEDDATKVERRVAKSAAAMVLLPKINQYFDAMVTGASEKGTFVRIFNPTLEGKLVRGFKGLDVGDRLKVKLISVDIPKGYIDFERA